MKAKWEVRQEAFSRLSDFSQENFSGIAVIKAFVKEYLELREFEKLNRENEDINVAYTRIATKPRQPPVHVPHFKEGEQPQKQRVAEHQYPIPEALLYGVQIGLPRCSIV